MVQENTDTDPVSKSPVLKTMLDDDVATSESLEKLVLFSAHQGATDLYCTAAKEGYEVSLRCDGLIRQLGQVPAEWAERLINHVKVEAGLDVTQHRRPQEGKTIIDDGGEAIDVRISTIPTLYGEDAALRILDNRQRRMNLDQLGILDRDRQTIDELIRQPNGLVLVSGPTGSGKTTTLYALLSDLNNGKRKINTIEDPVELHLAGTHQTQVNTRINLDFSEILPAVLRQDPDIIMVGEIRDGNTAKVAVRAASAGQLVLATSHAPQAAGAIHTMLGLGMNPHLLAGSLRAVIAQSLVRRICSECATSVKAEELTLSFDDIEELLPKDLQLRRGQGCENCAMTGFRRQVGIFSILKCTSEIRELIETEATPEAIEKKAVQQGMIPLRRAAKVAIARGLTSAQEVIRVFGSIE